MPKFAKFMLVISLFKYSGKNFLDRFLNLPRGMTCLQNIFFNTDFLIYFEFIFNILAFFRYFYWTYVLQQIAISTGTSPYYLG